MDCHCDYERPDAYIAKRVRARVVHLCYECAGGVMPGELYERVFTSYDGSAETVKTCQRCLELREFVKAHVPCSCWLHGSANDDLMADAEHWNSQAPGLWFGAARRLVAIKRGPLHRREASQGVATEFTIRGTRS